MASHVVYVDDSGTKEYAWPPETYANNNRGKSRYFVFGATLATTAEAGRLSVRVRSLKREVFGTDAVEIKSNWLRIPKERDKRYCIPYKLSNEDIHKFVDALYDVVCGAEIKFIAAVVDKSHSQERYGTSAWYPPAIAYDMILQRVQAELAGVGKTTVVIDNMTGATPKNRQYRQNLERQHELLKQHGSQLQRGFRLSSVEGRLRFVNSADYDLIQVSDLAAYNVYRQFVEHGDKWEEDGATTLPTYEYFDRIGRKFRCDERGRVQGYGVAKFPLRKRIPWKVPPLKSKKAAP